MKYKFEDYLHSNAEVSEDEDEYLRQGLPEHIAREIAESRPFYEIKLECEYDSETGKTTILSARQT